MVMVPLIIMISSDNFYCFLQFEGGGGHVPQCPIAGDATALTSIFHTKNFPGCYTPDPPFNREGKGNEKDGGEEKIERTYATGTGEGRGTGWGGERREERGGKGSRRLIVRTPTPVRKILQILPWEGKGGNGRGGVSREGEGCIPALLLSNSSPAYNGYSVFFVRLSVFEQTIGLFEWSKKKLSRQKSIRLHCCLRAD
jgi:hypothetical protein